jgi:hypothetical protein
MSSNMDGESGRRDNIEESWSNYPKDRQHVSYQSGKESDSTWSKQAHRNEVPLSSRASSRWEDEYGTLRIENQIANIMTKGVQVEVFRRLRAMMNVESLDTMN